MIESFDTLPKRVRPGQTVYVTDALARQTEGRLVRLSDASMTLLVQGTEREFPRSDVRQVARRGDSLANGTAIGMGTVGGLVLLSALFADDPEVNDIDNPGAALAVGATVVMAGIGAGIGALIDQAVKGKTVIYRATPVTVTASPLFRPGGAGVAVALRF